MTVSEKQKQYAEKYIKNTFDEIKLRVARGDKPKIQAHAEKMGESTNAFIKRAIDEAMVNDNEKSR